MTRTNHTRRQLAKVIAAAIATAALLAPGVLANSGARNSGYDPWFKNAIATQRSQPDPWFSNAVAKQASPTTKAKQTGYRFITDTLDGIHQPATSGYRFITDTLAPGGGDSSGVAAVTDGFNWADAGVGAASTLGLALLVLTGRTLALRKRGRLAF
jgi:hypothetical protein